MEIGVYVDVLLVLNYAVNLALLAGTAKLAGRKTRGRRIVAAALFGSVSSLTIFLPLMGTIPLIILRFGISAVIVRLAFTWISWRAYAREWFLFFAVTFCFAGLMLGIWMVFRPAGMVYYNSVVYFDISSVTLLVTTVAAYGVLELIHRFTRKGRVREAIYQVTAVLGTRSVTFQGMVDTGNSLYEPFSGIPVVVCSLERVAPLLPPGTAECLLRGGFEAGEDCGLPLRGIPYQHVGGSGLLPALRPDRLILKRAGHDVAVERVFLAVSRTPIGDERYDAVLHPDLAGISVNGETKSLLLHRK